MHYAITFYLDVNKIPCLANKRVHLNTFFLTFNVALNPKFLSLKATPKD